MTKPAVSRKVRRPVAAVIAAVPLTAVGVAGTARAQLPELPPVPPLPEMEDILPPELKDKRIEVQGIGGLDFAPPAPLEGITLPSSNTYTVKSDSTRLIGNVKISYVSFPTTDGPRPAVRIDADKVVLDNLRVRFPAGPNGVRDIWQRSGPGQITTLTGNFHIVVAAMEVTPQIAGIALPVGIPIDASWAPEELGRELKKVGAGLPDAISEQTVMLNGTMETYYISSDRLDNGPGTTIGL